MCFFSSRSRHTRYWRDWSSDVCSADLGALHGFRVVAAGGGRRIRDVGQAARAAERHRQLARRDPAGQAAAARKSVVQGKSGDLGGTRIIIKKHYIIKKISPEISTQC